MTKQIERGRGYIECGTRARGFSERSFTQRGFTLVELMISLAVGVGLLAGVLSVFVTMKSTSSETTGYGELQENGRFALSLITDDLLRQNFWGDFTGNLGFSSLITSPSPLGIASDCVGEGVNNASFPVAVGHFRTIWGKTVTTASNMGCINNATIGSDILQLKRVVATPVEVASLSNNRYYLASNLNSAAIFSGDSAVPAINNSRIWQYQHHIYYIRNELQGSGSNALSVPVLMQGRLQNSATLMNIEPLVDGIEYIRFMYGVDSDDDGIVNAFISADNMSNAFWDNELGSQIIAVKVFVLARSIFPDHSYENNHSYQLGDLSLTFNDNYRRLLFSSTTTLYNARVDSW